MSCFVFVCCMKFSMLLVRCAEINVSVVLWLRHLLLKYLKLLGHYCRICTYVFAAFLLK